MLHNNGNWQPQQPPTLQGATSMQQQQQPTLLQPVVPLQQQQQPHYTGQMFSQTAATAAAPPVQTQWMDPQQQQQSSYNNYFVGQQPQPQLQQHPPQQPQYVPAAVPAMEAMPQFYQHTEPQLQTAPTAATEVFDNNNSVKNDGWGDWGDWNETANSNNNHNNSANVERNQQQQQQQQQERVSLEDSFNVQSQSSWQAFGANNYNNNKSNVEQTNAAVQLLTTQPNQHAVSNAYTGLELPPPILPPPPVVTAAESELEAIVPPRAFQNQPLAAPPMSVPPQLEAAATASNPFKRGGAVKNQRVNILATTTAAAPPIAAPIMPPAPLTTVDLSVDSAALLHETTQEVLAAPNDERAQYLQTSHLSEQPEAEASNWEADNVLPPPGLSRLVLGQPELMDTQRLVTGTEQPEKQHLNVGIVNALHMEERQADGEDTSDSEMQPRSDAAAPVSLGSSTGNISADRNLYHVAGESNGNAQQTPPQRRVVPGVETATVVAAITPIAPTSLVPAGEQREVVLDGENLEDQRDAITVTSATATAAITTTPTISSNTISQTDHYQTQIHHNSNSNNNNSTGNDESEPQRSSSQREEKKRMQQTQQARGKQRGQPLQQALESEDSDEFLLSERERDRREKRRESERELNDAVRQRRSTAGDDDYDQDYEQHRSQHYHARRDKPHDATKTTTRSGRRSYDGVRVAEENAASTLERRRRQEHNNSTGNDESEPQRNSSQRDEKKRTPQTQQARGKQRGQPQQQALESADSDEFLLSERERDRRETRRERERELKEAGRQRRSGAAVDDYDQDYEQHRSQLFHARRDKPHDATKTSTRSSRRSYEGRRGAEENTGSTLERRRRQEQRHWDAREYEEYRRKSSRNSDLEKERTNGASAMGSSKRRSNYDYNAYDPYGMYEQMSRDPLAYAEMCSKMYGQMINSMAAAVNAAAVSKVNHGHQAPNVSLTQSSVDPAQHLIAAATAGGTNEAALLRERERTGVVPTTFGAPLDTSSSYGVGSVVTSSAVTTTAVARPPRRRTPLLFNRPHLVASYAMSLLLKVKPKYAGRGKLRNDVEVAAPRIKDSTSSLLRAYPGPLQGRKLHKDKIINFCKEQIRLGPPRNCSVLYATQKKPQGNVDKYRASHALMWHLLILLLRQNGVIADTDVGDLLLENQKEYPYNAAELQGEGVANDASNVDAVDSETGSTHSTDAAAQHSAPAAQSDEDNNDEVSLNAVPAEPLSEQEATDKFRNYVLRGNVEEALQWATDNNLWTHAFFLALYEDRYALTDVAQKFLNRVIKANDPLQTLYQMKSCHTPTCVTQLRDEQWGDWRTHLAILVTNKSRQPEYDRGSVVSLGDTLFQRGDIYAAHFCYLVAQEEFGRYDSAATELSSLTANVPKLILLGSSHYKHFNEFANNEAIIMTEIYEYARALFDQKFSIVNFQHYKFLLATRILDYGQHFRCTNYLEQIGKHIELKPDSYALDFIERVYTLAERLRYHDPILINRVSFASPPTATGNNNHSNNNASQLVTGSEEKSWLRHLRALVETQPMQAEQVQEQYQQQVQTQNDIDQQFAEVNKQFRELNMQYAANNIDDTLQLNKDVNLDAMQQQQQQQHQQQLSNEQQQQPTQTDYYEPPAQSAEPVPLAADAYSSVDQQQYYYPNAAAQQQQQPQLYDTGVAQQSFDNSADNYMPNAEANAAAATVTNPNSYAQPAAGYDYWANAQQHGGMSTPYGTIAEEHVESNESDNKHNSSSGKENNVEETQEHVVEKSDTNKNKPDSSQGILSSNNNNNNNYRFKQNAIKLSAHSNNKSSTGLEKSKAIRKLQFDRDIDNDKRSSQSNNNNNNHIVPKQQLTAAAVECATAMATATTTSTTTMTSSNKAFNLNDQHQQQQMRPSISMPKSKTYNDDEDNKMGTGSGAGPVDGKNGKSAGKQQQPSLGEPGAQGNAGWFGGLWNKLSLKPKNPMRLPDDKNPTIVWDKERKCWINTESNAEETEAFKPPPKMSDMGMPNTLGSIPTPIATPNLLPQQQQQQASPPPAAAAAHPQEMPMQNMYGNQVDYTASAALPELYAAPAAIPSPAPSPLAAVPGAAAAAPGGAQPKLQSNMFKMQRNRTLKNSYVDVFNPSGAPMSNVPDNVLAPMMAPASVPQGGYFVPGAAPQ